MNTALAESRRLLELAEADLARKQGQFYRYAEQMKLAELWQRQAELEATGGRPATGVAGGPHWRPSWSPGVLPTDSERRKMAADLAASQ